MIQNETTTSLARKSLIIISIHAMLYIIFCFSQEKISVLYTVSIYLPYIILFGFVPLIFSIILLTNYARHGSIVLLGILPAAIINNIVNRFTGLPIIAIQQPSLIWRIMFEVSFGLILISEIVAFWFTLKLLLTIHKQMKNTSNEKSTITEEKP